MVQAIELAKNNVLTQHGGPFGAVIVKDGLVVASGANRVTATNDPTAHAEIVAIRAACAHEGVFHLQGCVLYTSCEPCPMCLGALYWAHIETVYYAGTKDDAAAAGFDDSFIYEQLHKPHEQRLIPMHHVMQKEAQEVFSLWRSEHNKIAY